MNTPATLKRIITGTLLSGGVAVAGLGVATGTSPGQPGRVAVNIRPVGAQGKLCPLGAMS